MRFWKFIGILMASVWVWRGLIFASVLTPAVLCATAAMAANALGLPVRWGVGSVLGLFVLLVSPIVMLAIGFNWAGVIRGR